MFYLISKLFAFLVLPLGILLILVICMIISKNRTKTKQLGFLTLSLTYLFSCPLVVHFITYRWEIPPRNIQNIENYDLGILLTGGLINENAKFPDNLHLSPSGDRLWQTLQLFKKEKIKSIIISGGDNSILSNKKQTEIDYAYKFLVGNGIPSNAIIIENKARNTHDNAVFSAKIIRNKKYKKLLLITSAFHERRALACFKKQGIVLAAYPTNPFTSSSEIEILDLIPTGNAFKNSELIMKEVVGFLVYKIMGYV
jgi:uncharacterized SAM-binding protein YcdF (DUF218 family)